MTHSPAHTLPTPASDDLHALRPWGAMRTALVSAVTFGLFPLIAWRGQLSRQIAAERHLLGKAIDELSPRISASDAAALRQVAGQPAEQWFAAVVIGMCAITLFWFALIWYGQEGLKFNALLASTYYFEWHALTPLAWRRNLFIAWTVSLSVAYAAHWAAIQWHVSRLQKLVEHINRMRDVLGHSPLEVPQIGVGLSPRWIMGAALMVLVGGYWGILAMMAGGVQRQYAIRVAPRWLHNLSSVIPPSVRRTDRRTCTNPRCHKQLSNDARYCSRCGAKV